VCRKQLYSNSNLGLKTNGNLRRIDRSLTEKPKAEGKHENKLMGYYFWGFWRIRSLNELLVYNNQKSNC